MASPEEFIEITDFGLGIWSDMHAATIAGLIAADNADNAAFQRQPNGAATIENTYNCKVDRSGALIPLPAAAIFADTPLTGHIPANEYTTANRPADHPYAMLLDAELSPQRWYFELDTGNPLALSAPTAPSIYTLWGFFHNPDDDGVADGYYLYILGREYRYRAPFEPVYDYAFMRSDLAFGPGGDYAFMNFPAGSLCLSRLDHSSNPTVIAAFGVFFTTKFTTPVMVAVMSIGFNGNPYGMNTQTGAIPAAEQAWLTDYHDTAGSAVTVKRPQAYSPTLVDPGDMTGRVGSTAIGMSLGSDGYDVGTAHPIDEWSWHHKDDAIDLSALPNMPFLPYMIIPHQGRVVMPDRTGYRDFIISQEVSPAGGSTDEWRMYFSDDILWYSRWGQPIGDPYTPAATERMRGYIPLQVAEDQVSPIGVLGVVTADELLVVKARGGGALVRGDLDNPTIRRLPHIEPTGGISSKGAQTPIGYVYGTRTGVFAFDGGDTTRKLSRQIDGWFWDPHIEEGSVQLEGSYGRFGYWNDMVFVPNNYIYDVESDSWWRVSRQLLIDLDPLTYIECPPYSIYLVGDEGRLYLFPSRVTATTAANSGRVHHLMDMRFLSHEYSWQSQPLFETRGRRLSFQDIRIDATAVGASQIRVTLRGYDEKGGLITTSATTMSMVANIDRPQILRADIRPNFVAEYVQVRIETTTGTFAVPVVDGTPAPKIHAVKLGIKPRQSTIRHG